MYDVIIIGGGPAGLTAAIYSSRALLKVLVIEGPQPGGQLTTTTEIENFPGFPEGIMGPTLMEKMKEQAKRFGTEMMTDTITTIKKEKTFRVTGQTREYEGKAVIIATGANAKHLGVPTEDTFRGKGISYCATCDGFFFRGKTIAVLGGGDTAMEEATFLTKFASSVTIIHRREGFRASPIMLDRARKNPKIKFQLNTIVEEFYGEGILQGLITKDVITGKTEKLPFDGVFIAIGYTPATDFLKGTVDPDSIGVDIDEKGYILTGKAKYATQTTLEGVFAAGDCVDKTYRQGIVAAGMGTMAALDVEKYLQEIS